MTVAAHMIKRVVVFCGPSGVGKSTILKLLFAKHPDVFKFSISRIILYHVHHLYADTTRQPRAGEQHGREYYFVSHADFERLLATDQFIEHTTFAGNYYGTSQMAVAEIQKEGKVCVLD